jgi:hypothetical protein
MLPEKAKTTRSSGCGSAALWGRLATQCRIVFTLATFHTIRGAANSGCSRLLAGFRRAGRLATPRKSRLKRRLRAELPAPRGRPQRNPFIEFNAQLRGRPRKTMVCPTVESLRGAKGLPGSRTTYAGSCWLEKLCGIGLAPADRLAIGPAGPSPAVHPSRRRPRRAV